MTDPFGEAVPVLEGIWAVRLPVPSRLGHVNAYVFDDGDGWAVIDCGYDSADVRAIWDHLFSGAFGGRPLRRLITTHGHTDHVGAAMHLLRKDDAAYETTLIEWQAARLRFFERDATGDDAFVRFSLTHGCDLDTARSFMENRREVTRYLGEQPSTFQRISHNDRVNLGGRVWTALVASGHAEAHLSLYCEDERILLAGDQVLPSISPLIPVSVAEPDGNPLAAFLASLEFFATLPAETLVLPGHGRPFQRLGPRCAEIAGHHRERLSRILELITLPMTCFEVAGRIFGEATMRAQGRLAMSEVLAHLNFLVVSGGAVRTRSDTGLLHYSSAIGD